MKILIVEDDKELQTTLLDNFAKEGYEIEIANDGEEAYDLLQISQYEAVILDGMLPKMDGFSLLKTIRKEGNQVPILMLTAKDDVKSRVMGLDYGADDYLVKPFAMPELFARLRVLLRRSVQSQEKVILQCGTIIMYPEEATVFVGEEQVHLSNKEFKLLEFLLWNKGRIVTKEQIYERIWGLLSDRTDGIVDLYIHYLRKKLTPFDATKYLENVRGIGYRMKE